SMRLAAISSELEVITMRLLEKEPANRYQSAGEVIDALGGIAGKLSGRIATQLVMSGDSAPRLDLTPRPHSVADAKAPVVTVPDPVPPKMPDPPPTKVPDRPPTHVVVAKTPKSPTPPRPVPVVKAPDSTPPPPPKSDDCRTAKGSLCDSDLGALPQAPKPKP